MNKVTTENILDVHHDTFTKAVQKAAEKYVDNCVKSGIDVAMVNLTANFKAVKSPMGRGNYELSFESDSDVKIFGSKKNESTIKNLKDEEE